MSPSIVIVDIRYLDDTDEQYHNAYVCYDIEMKTEYVKLYMRDVGSKKVIHLIIPMSTIRFIKIIHDEEA